MKKITLLLGLVLSSFFAFNQTKYVTFSDSIIYSQASVDTYSPKIAAIPNDGNYLLTSIVGMASNYSITKLTYEGQVFKDTVLSFQFMGGYPNINSLQVTGSDATIWSSYQSNNYPFVINLDINGNMNWNYIYSIDTLFFNVTGGIKSANGSLLSFGNVNAYPASYGYILKTDMNGAIIWSKLYGQKANSSILDWTGAVENLVETPDGGFMFSTGVGDLLSGNRYPVVTKIDANGNILWNKTFEFLYPISNIDNYNNPIRSILPIDSTSLLLTFQLVDTTLNANVMGLISISTFDGSINWKKLYHLYAGDLGLNFNKMIKKADGNFVGYYNRDMLGSVLFELDQTGQMIKSLQLREQPSITQNTTNYSSIAPTNDGGVIMTANLLSNNQGNLIYKTDKNLQTYCPETEYPYLAIEDTLGLFPRVSVDTMLVATFTTQSAVLGVQTAYNQSTNSRFCTCELIVSGNVSYTASGIPADSVMMYLFQVTANGNYIKVDSIATDLTGYYQFNYLPTGDYVVKAVPTLPKYSGFMPSYFSMPNPTLQWDSAIVMHKECGFNSLPSNINLIPKLSQSGTWRCNGYVLQYYGYGSGVAKAAGEPLGDIDITLNQSPGGAVSSVKTDLNGFFEFTGLNNNASFVLRADMPGYPNDSIYSFTVNPGDPAMDSLNFYVSADSVYILPEYIFIGVNILSTKTLEVSISPNPTKSNFVLEVNSKKNSSVNFTLCNSVGQEVFAKEEKLTKGNHRINFDIKDYPQGIYYLRIINENDYFVKKIIKQ